MRKALFMLSIAFLFVGLWTGVALAGDVCTVCPEQPTVIRPTIDNNSISGGSVLFVSDRGWLYVSFPSISKSDDPIVSLPVIDCTLCDTGNPIVN